MATAANTGRDQQVRAELAEQRNPDLSILIQPQQLPDPGRLGPPNRNNADRGSYRLFSCSLDWNYDRISPRILRKSAGYL